MPSFDFGYLTLDEVYHDCSERRNSFFVYGHSAMFWMIGQAHWLTVSAFMVWIQIVIQANSLGVSNSIGSGVSHQERPVLVRGCKRSTSSSSAHSTTLPRYPGIHRDSRTQPRFRQASRVFFAIPSFSLSSGATAKRSYCNIMNPKNLSTTCSVFRGCHLVL